MVIKSFKINESYLIKIIAFEARRDWGLQDCDVSSSNSLCTNGANYIRNKRQHLV